MNSYKDLKVWQKSIELVVQVYTLTKSFPKEELYGLTSQIRRAAISIPSNIAEGFARRSKKDHIHFLRIAYASGAELETQLIIAAKLEFARQIDFFVINGLVEEIMKMLNGLMISLGTRN